MRHVALKTVSSINRSGAGMIRARAAKKIEDLKFENSTLKKLAVDDPDGKRYLEQRQVRGANFSRVRPTPLDNPKLVAASQPALVDLLELDPAELNRADFAEFFGGNKIIPGAEPAAHCYCGHQFGHFSGQLGDGATMYLGEVINDGGERWEVQFKGAGKTPFSRTADGRKVLRSSIREFLASEAMAALGVPTTRAGAVVTSDSRVVRDIFYSGNPIQERCTVVTRIAPTFLRFGSFEIFKPTDRTTGRAGPSVGLEGELLPRMVHFVVEQYYPDIAAKYPAEVEGSVRERAREMLGELVDRTAKLVAAWQSVGWCHGVLNTDNMSVVGVTIDYGPFGFMDRFDPDFICNASDDGGRYTYAAQPEICKWNLGKFAEALAPVLPKELADKELARYDASFSAAYLGRMRAKLGLRKELPEDPELVRSLMVVMRVTGADFTHSFRRLSVVAPPGAGATEAEVQQADALFLMEVLEGCATPKEIAESVRPKVAPEQLKVLLQIADQQPEMLPRLGLSREFVEQEVERVVRFGQLSKMSAADKAKADRGVWESWLAAYKGRLEKEAFGAEAAAKGWASAAERAQAMDATNPKYILRNYIAENAIAAAESGDFSEVQRVLKRLEDPYGLTDGEAAEAGAFADTREAAAASSAAKGERGVGETLAAAAAKAAVAAHAAAAAAVAGAGQAARAAGAARREAVPYDSLPPKWASEISVT